MKGWTAIVLAAGRGTRLRPFTEDRPKPLVEVGGRPLLGHLLQRCAEAGAGEALVVVGDRGAMVREWLSARAPLPWRAVENAHYADRGNGWSLRVAAAAVDTPWCVKLDGDVILAPSLLAELLAGATGSRVAYDPDRDLDEEAMKVQCEAGRVRALGKGLTTANGETLGVELLDAGSLQRVATAIERCPADAYYEDAYQLLIDEGWPLAGTPVTGAWTEVDDGGDLARAEALWTRGALG